MAIVESFTSPGWSRICNSMPSPDGQPSLAVRIASPELPPREILYSSESVKLAYSLSVSQVVQPAVRRGNEVAVVDGPGALVVVDEPAGQVLAVDQRVAARLFQTQLVERGFAGGHRQRSARSADWDRAAPRDTTLPSTITDSVRPQRRIGAECTAGEARGSTIPPADNDSVAVAHGAAALAFLERDLQTGSGGNFGQTERPGAAGFDRPLEAQLEVVDGPTRQQAGRIGVAAKLPLADDPVSRFAWRHSPSLPANRAATVSAPPVRRPRARRKSQHRRHEKPRIRPSCRFQDHPGCLIKVG